jgi:hypothetical protein
VWKQLVEAQWPGGRVLCQHNILRHSFLDAFRSHQELLSVDPVNQRGSFPNPVAIWLMQQWSILAELDVQQQYSMPAAQHYSMLVELRYFDPNVNAPDTASLLISPPLSITTTRHRTTTAPLLISPASGDVLTSALEPEQKIRIPLPRNFNPHHLLFAVTIVRKRDAKCKRIFQFPSHSEEFFDFSDTALLFDCPSASELAHRALDPCMEKIDYFTRCASGLQVQLGIAPRSDVYQAECVEIYSYGDNGEPLEGGIENTLLRIEHAGIWF